VAAAPAQAELRFLDALTPAQLDALRSLGAERRYAAGSVLFREGDAADGVLLVLSGRVKLSCVTHGGREAVLGIREGGDLIGEMSAIEDQQRSATGTALEDVRALVVASTAFAAYLERTPGMALILLRVLARRLRDADRKRVEFLAFDTVGRVCARLVELAERFGEPAPEGIRIGNAITQEELAGWTGSSREAVIKALRSLRELGWISTGRRDMTILDMEALRRRAM
jgi:CRP/FNR family transcriptional regulator, cyclic AMP receptor protein